LRLSLIEGAVGSLPKISRALSMIGFFSYIRVS
jgi:hypothetical protein